MKLKNTKILAGILASLLLSAASTARAANENVSLSLSFDYNSHFMSYGVNVWGDDTDAIGDEFLFQPSAQVDFALTETSGIYAGVWFDINDIAEDSIGGNFQEIDVWLGYFFGAGDFTFDFTFQQWYYGSETEGIFDVAVSYDAMFAPYIKAHSRFEGVGDQEKGTIFEVGGTLYETSYEGIDFSFPVAVAFNFDDYHVAGEDGYAYFTISAAFAYALPISDAYGSWDLHGALSYWNTDDDNVGNPEDDYVTLNLGIGLSF